MTIGALIAPAFALALAPLLPGIVTRAKSIVAGRQGPPLSQPYHDIARLLRKGAVYSSTTSWLFRSGPIVGLAMTNRGRINARVGGLRVEEVKGEDGLR